MEITIHHIKEEVWHAGVKGSDFVRGEVSQ